MATSSNLNCQWCNQPLIGIQQVPVCTIHKVCNKCRINKRTCQSMCPCCWYDNGTKFVSQNNICPVCCKGLQCHGGIPTCFSKHNHCSQCSPSGCILCKFLGLRSWTNSTFDSIPNDIQPIIATCDTWEKKYETQYFNRQDSSMMDVDDNLETIGNSCLPKPNIQNTENKDCRICLDDLDASSITLPTCQHRFHRNCIEKWFQSSGKQSCPTCGYIYGIYKGPQPAHGQMTYRCIPTTLPGFQNEIFKPNELPTIEITYTIPSGIQGPLNPQPGQPYSGTTRTAYLPNNNEGKYILSLLQRAFNDQHIFTIGQSTTTGRNNVVTWNDIHHKTNIAGGPEQFGYPDPTYLTRVRQELADKGYR